jgi:hypothetical protein
MRMLLGCVPNVPMALTVRVLRARDIQESNIKTYGDVCRNFALARGCIALGVCLCVSVCLCVCVCLQPL